MAGIAVVLLVAAVVKVATRVYYNYYSQEGFYYSPGVFRSYLLNALIIRRGVGHMKLL